MNITRYLQCTLLPALSVLFCTSAIAAAPNYCPDRTLRVAMFDYGVFYDSATGKGLDVDLLNELSKRTGCKMELIELPRARHWMEVPEGTLDMMTAATTSPERAQKVFLLPYMRARNRLIVGPTAPPEVKDIKSFMERPNLLLGMIRIYLHEAELDALIGQLRTANRVQEEADGVQLFQALATGIVAAIPAQPHVYRRLLRTYKIEDKVRIIDFLPEGKAVIGHIAFSRKNFTEQQVENWRTVINTMLKDGTAHRLAKAYLPENEAKEVLGN